jgi:hypothetical protein
MPGEPLTRTAERAGEIARSLKRELGPLPSGISVSGFNASYGAVGEFDHYRKVPSPAAAALAQVTSALGEAAGRTFLRAALAQGIAELISSRRLDALPPRIRLHQSNQLERIAGAAESNAEWIDLGNNLFLKDFGLVTLRLYAAASNLLDLRCGISRSLIAKEGIAAAPKNILKFARLGGFRPFIQIHTHLSYLDEFNEEGRNECYRCCVDLYQLKPALLGMFGSSWFYDPLLADISPHLNYLRDVPMAGGAELFFVGTGDGAIDGALITSQTRRKLYEAGRYLPTTYLIAWGKKAQTAWAARNPRQAF